MYGIIENGPARRSRGRASRTYATGQPCRVLARGRNGNTLVQFKDGTLIVGVRYCVRATDD